MRGRTHAVACAALPLALFTAIGLPTATASAETSPTVVTDRGAIHGAVTGGVERFLGIPYAAAPTGALRWRPPQPAAAWTGVRGTPPIRESMPGPAEHEWAAQ
jgi:hypothetical protein